MEQHEQVSEYIDKLEGEKQAICTSLRSLLMERFPDLSEEFKWSRPVYESGSKGVCYMVANKNDVSFGFNRGSELDDPSGKLQGTGKQMRHLKLKKTGDLDADYVAGLVRQAVELER